MGPFGKCTIFDKLQISSCALSKLPSIFMHICFYHHDVTASGRFSNVYTHFLFICQSLVQYLIPWIKANLARSSKWCSLDVAPEVKPMTWERRGGQIHLFGLLSINNYNLMKCENTQAAIQRIMVKYYGFFFLCSCGLNMSRCGGAASCHTLLSSWLAHRHGHHAPYPQVRPSLVVNDNRKW